MPLVRFDDAQHSRPNPGIHSTLTVGPKVGSTRLSTGFTTFDPGGEVPPHRHAVEEAVSVLEGEGFCVVGGERFDLNPLDTIYIPAMVVHSFVNPGPGRLRILWSRPGVNVVRLPAEDEP